MEIPFSFRVKIGDQGIEISGIRYEVMKTPKALPRLMENVLKAFELIKTGQGKSQSANPLHTSIFA